jgi:hypothetical protein
MPFEKFDYQSFPQPETTTVTTAEKLLIPTTVTTEAMVQAELYSALQAKGIRCVLEYRINNHCRLDCAVAGTDNQLVAIVECKNYRNIDKPFNESTKQFAKYSSFGVPVIGCVRLTDIDGVVLRIQNLLGSESLDTDKLFESLRDLTNDSFRAWYCDAFWKLGGAKVVQIADQARKGNRPRNLFSWLLKQELEG